MSHDVFLDFPLLLSASSALLCRVSLHKDGMAARCILLLVLIKRIHTHGVTTVFFPADVASSPTLIICLRLVSLLPALSLSLSPFHPFTALVLLYAAPYIALLSAPLAAMPRRKMYNTLRQCNGTVLFVSSCVVITRSRARVVCSGSVPETFSRDGILLGPRFDLFDDALNHTLRQNFLQRQ